MPKKLTEQEKSDRKNRFFRENQLQRFFHPNKIEFTFHSLIKQHNRFQKENEAP